MVAYFLKILLTPVEECNGLGYFSINQRGLLICSFATHICNNPAWGGRNCHFSELSPTWVIGSFMTRTSVTFPNCPKYSRSLSCEVCQDNPPTNNLPGAESEFGVERPLDSPCEPISPFDIGSPVRWSIDSLKIQNCNTKIKNWLQNLPLNSKATVHVSIHVALKYRAELEAY